MDLIHAGPWKSFMDERYLTMLCLLSGKVYSKIKDGQFQGNPQFFNLRYPEYGIKKGGLIADT